VQVQGHDEHGVGGDVRAADGLAVPTGSDYVIAYAEADPQALSCRASKSMNLQTVPQETQISARLVASTGRINAGNSVATVVQRERIESCLPPGALRSTAMFSWCCLW
jgi:hypothetical protein